MCAYFAYGCNINRAHMAGICPGAAVLGSAVLVGHRLVFPRRCTEWRGGVAGLAPDRQGRVEGVLWSIVDDDLAALDDYEDVDEGHYTRSLVEVRRGDGSGFEAWTYFAVAQRGGPFLPAAPYVKAMLAGATENCLSAGWVQMVGRLSQDGGEALALRKGKAR